MKSKAEGVGERACWFVGAAYGGTKDQSSLDCAIQKLFSELNKFVPIYKKTDYI